MRLLIFLSSVIQHAITADCDIIIKPREFCAISETHIKWVIQIYEKYLHIYIIIILEYNIILEMHWSSFHALV